MSRAKGVSSRARGAGDRRHQWSKPLHFFTGCRTTSNECMEPPKPSLTTIGSGRSVEASSKAGASMTMEAYMVERVSPRQFREFDGVEDWRVLATGAVAYFATGSFAKGVELVDAIGRLADAADHHPDVDLRYAGVRVSLVTHEIGDISDRDVAVAQQISVAADDLGISADPSKL